MTNVETRMTNEEPSGFVIFSSLTLRHSSLQDKARGTYHLN